MKFKIISSLAIATVSIAAFALISTAYGFAESFATASVVMMLPFAFEPLRRTNRPFAETAGILRTETTQSPAAFRGRVGNDSRVIAIHRQAA